MKNVLVAIAVLAGCTSESQIPKTEAAHDLVEALCEQASRCEPTLDRDRCTTNISAAVCQDYPCDGYVLDVGLFDACLELLSRVDCHADTFGVLNACMTAI